MRFLICFRMKPAWELIDAVQVSPHKESSAGQTPRRGVYLPFSLIFTAYLALVIRADLLF